MFCDCHVTYFVVMVHCVTHTHKQHVDHYSRTKAVAEKLVMGACGTKVSGRGVGLKTCSLRCAGIYGEGERRHLPRIVVCVIKKIKH